MFTRTLLKLKDPCSFTIPCRIGELAFNKALYDIGASVSLMPYSIYEKIDFGELKPTTMCLSMADKYIKYPLGVLENVPTKVGKFIIPADFIVMDMEEDPKIPILLGRPFLMTAGVVIGMKNGKIKVEVNDESIVFDVYKMIKTYPPIEVCERINSLDIIDDCVNDIVHEYIGKDSLSILMSQGTFEKHSNKEVLACVSVLELAPSTYPYRY